tara:strand:+ start:371 stop:958 length:588 start_codon:yes stop_codon:yes gene_type:complete
MITHRNNNKTKFYIVLPIFTIIGIGVFTVLSGFYEESWSFSWKDIRAEVKDSVVVAEKRNYLSSGYVGEAYERPNEFYTRKWITENATIDELLKLTEYPNGVVRAIAYEGLLNNRDFKRKKELILKSLKDTLYPISYASGCIIGMKRNIAEYIIKDITELDTTLPPPPPNPNGFVRYDFELSENDKKEILKEYYK